ncbi:MAG: hypothetical protein MK028_02060 [Dehalococcoidia bacterium]|nr:hypothetical protein [Dehalococcoidia bacterium]
MNKKFLHPIGLHQDFENHLARRNAANDSNKKSGCSTLVSFIAILVAIYVTASIVLNL